MRPIVKWAARTGRVFSRRLSNELIGQDEHKWIDETAERSASPMPVHGKELSLRGAVELEVTWSGGTRMSQARRQKKQRQIGSGQNARTKGVFLLTRRSLSWKAAWSPPVTTPSAPRSKIPQHLCVRLPRARQTFAARMGPGFPRTLAEASDF